MYSAMFKAPEGKTRVIGTDLFTNTCYLFGDYQDEDEACGVTDNHNENRSSNTDDIFSAYDDQGNRIRAILNLNCCGH